MTRTLTAMFNDRSAADAAVTQLVQELKINRGQIQVHAAEAASVATTTGEGGFWSSLKDLFVPDEDRYAYAEGIRRGGALVSAEVDEGALDHAMNILEHQGAVDIDAQEAEWRKSGWSGYQADTTTSGTVATMPSTPEVGVAATDMLSTGTAAATSRATMPAATATTVRAGADEVIPIVEEQIRVGKRDVERGRVRVRTYVVETPVTEQVALRNEQVDVQRRAVDRPVTDADQAFQERIIEVTETDEEVVVAKQARIVEEVVIRKDATERTETVQDTVRRTEVEVEDATDVSRTVESGNLADSTISNSPDTVASRNVDNALGTNVSGAHPEQADGTPENPPGTTSSRAMDKTLGTNVSGANPNR
jgi:uncharacterized protein (TIGR02271 family)